MRFLIPFASLFLASPAHAVGVGTSIAFSQDGFWTYSPTLDLLFDPVVVQIHLIETLDQAFESDLYLGANVVVGVADVAVTDRLHGVVQPGGALWINGDPTEVSLAGIARVGMEVGNDVRAGLYVVPYLGITIEDGDTSLFASGGLQFAIAFGR